MKFPNTEHNVGFFLTLLIYVKLSDANKPSNINLMSKLKEIVLGASGIVFASPVLASAPVAPEIDGAGLFLVLGLVVSVLALVRDRFNKK